MGHIDLSTIPVGVRVLIGVLIVVQITLDVIALRDLYMRPVAQVIFANKWSWVAIILLGNLLGPSLYLAAGRKKAVLNEDVVSPRSQHSGSIADELYGSRDDKGKN